MTDEEATAAWAKLDPDIRIAMIRNVPSAVLRVVVRDLQRSTLSKYELLRIHITSLKTEDIDEMARELTPEASLAVITLLGFFADRLRNTS